MGRYHMNKSEREITDKNELIEIIKHGRFTSISMCRNNEPYIVTMSYGYDEFNSSFRFISKPKNVIKMCGSTLLI